MSKHNFHSLTPDLAIGFITTVLKNAETAMTRILMHGDPGSGKSAIALAVAKALGATLIDLRLLQLDFGAFRGLEYVSGNPETDDVATKSARPAFFPPYVADEDITEDTPRYLILLDEIGACDDVIRKSAFELLTDHRSGPHKLGKNVWIIAATNSAEDGTNIVEFDRATADRFCHIMVYSAAEQLRAHALENGWHPYVTAALRANENIVSAQQDELQNNALAQSSSRSLHKVSNALHVYSAGKMSRDEIEWFMRGMIGNYAAEYIIDQLDNQQAQFDIEQLTSNPVQDRKYPTTEFGVFAMIDSLAAWAKDEERLEKAVKVVFEMPDNLTNVGSDARVTFIHQIEKTMNELKVFTKYALDPLIAPFISDTHQAVAEHDRAAANRRAA